MAIAATTLLYSAHPTLTATLAETVLTANSPRTGVLDQVRAETDRAHALVLAGNYQDAVPVYEAVRNRIFRLLTPAARSGSPTGTPPRTTWPTSRRWSGPAPRSSPTSCPRSPTRP